MPGPLEGVRVLDLSQIVSGPFAAMMLGDLGAEVVKVEPIGVGDPIRLSDFRRGGLQALYVNNNRGKRLITLNVTTDEGRAIVLDLAAGSDVVIQNMRPGVVDRLGVGYEACRARNPKIVYCSISGYGTTGPWAHRPVLDPVIQGVTGIVARQQSADIPIPDLVRMVIADKWTAQTAAQAITAALFRRERSGEGQHIDLAMLDTALYLSWPDLMMDRTFVGDGVEGVLRITDVYQLTDCADGKLIYFTSSLAQRMGMYRALGRPDLCDDPRYNTPRLEPEHFVSLGTVLRDEFAKVKRDEILARLVEHEVPCGPILDPDEMLENEQIVANGMLTEWEHPTAGTIRQPRWPAHFSGTPVEFRAECPLPGQDTEAILLELGRTPDEIAALRACECIA
jgi:crotonobetainyl-CoA:carnitine CoA-transferase CaiB-like acyl-CoA transferase